MLTLGCGILERYDATGWPSTLFWKKELHAWSNGLVKCLKLAIFFEIPKPTYFFFFFILDVDQSIPYKKKKMCTMWLEMGNDEIWRDVGFPMLKIRQTDLQHFAIISSSINTLFLKCVATTRLTCGNVIDWYIWHQPNIALHCGTYI